MKTIFLIVVTSITLGSCKKTYTCRCFNPGGTFESFTIRDSKKNAERRCNDYGKQYQDVPMSETACTTD